MDSEKFEDGVCTKKTKLLFFDISEFPSSIQFLLMVASTLFFCLISGYMQELIFRLEGFRPFGLYLTLIMFICFTMYGLIELQLKSDKKRRVPLKLYSLISFLTVLTMALSNSAVGYLNYPTYIIFKCCKLIPVMIGGVVIQGRKYNGIEVSAVMCMCTGLIFFALADSSLSPNFNTYGIVLISLALLADGLIGNVQEDAFRKYSSTESEMILYSYSIGLIYILLALLLTRTFIPAASFCNEHPVETYGYAVILSSFGYLGVKSVLQLIESYGALIAVTVTACRKAITIILSFIFFKKPFAVQYVWSGLVVLLGIYLNIYNKNKTSWDKYLSSKWYAIQHYLGFKSIPQYQCKTETII